MDVIAKAYLTVIVASLIAAAAWLTHVIVCIKTANYLFLIAGGLVAPIGVLHGLGVWIGAW